MNCRVGQLRSRASLRSAARLRVSSLRCGPLRRKAQKQARADLDTLREALDKARQDLIEFEAGRLTQQDSHSPLNWPRWEAAMTPP